MRSVNEMNSIKFTYLWDKLKDPKFTTIRSWTALKEEYYRENIGKDFQVWKAREKYPFDKEHVMFHAWLQEVRVLKPEDIPVTLLEKDVQLDGVPDAHWLTKIRKMDKAILLIFAKQPVITQKTLEVSD